MPLLPGPTIMTCRHLLPLAALLSLLFPAATLAQQSPGKVTFKKTVLDTVFRSEGTVVGDFNKDGRMDVAAGYVWYEAPDWTMRLTGEKAPEYDPHAYSNSFQTFADDVNADGWTDILVVDFPGTNTWWLENPQKADMPWPKHVLTPCTNNESPQLLDVDGDGKRDLLAAFSPDPKKFDGPERRMGFMSRTDKSEEPWTIHAISAPAAPGTNRLWHRSDERR